MIKSNTKQMRGRMNANTYKMTKVSLLLAMLIAAPLTYAVDDERAAAAYESRHGLFAMVRMYFGPMYGMMRGAPYNADVVKHNAAQISALAKMIPDAFVVDTRENDLDTEALDGIWQDINDFNSKAATLAERAAALSEQGSTGEDAFKAAFGGMGQACKACHDNYREQE